MVMQLTLDCGTLITTLKQMRDIPCKEYMCTNKIGLKIAYKNDHFGIKHSKNLHTKSIDSSFATVCMPSFKPNHGL